MNKDFNPDDNYAKCYFKSRSDIDVQAISIIDLISKFIGNPDDISVLDVGSGPGRLAIPIGKKVNKIVCVEPDLLAANYLELRLKKENINSRIYIEKFEKLPAKELGVFDLVIFSHVLHWFGKISIFELSTNLLKRNGFVLLSLFDRDRLEEMLFYKISGKEILNIQKEDTPLIIDIQRNLTNSGFEIVNLVEVPLSVNYGNGRLEQIIDCSGTLAWQKLKQSFPENEYKTIKINAINRLNMYEQRLADIEYRTMIMAKKIG